MTSYRTIIGTLVAALVVPWASRHGFPLDAEQQVWVVGGVVALLATTHMDVRALKAAWLARIQNKTVTLSPEVINTIAKAVVAEFASQQAKARSKADPNPIPPGQPAHSSGAKS